MARSIVIKQLKPSRKIPQNTTVQSEKSRQISRFADGVFMYASWAKVEAAHSERNTVDVVLTHGIELKHVDVASREWAGANATRGFGERDLPPVGCLVLILFPEGNLEGGIVLCSVLSFRGSPSEKQKVELLISGKEREKLRITEAGEKETVDKDTSARKLEVNGAEIEITAAGAVNIKPAAGQAIILNSGAIGANDLTNCLFNTALHCTNIPNTVKVP